jgi:hypothetical protein
VIGAAGIVAGTLAGILSEEYTARIHDAFCQLLVVADLQNQVFGSIGVGEGNHLINGIDEHVVAVF